MRYSHKLPVGVMQMPLFSIPPPLNSGLGSATDTKPCQLKKGRLKTTEKVKS